jgi:type 2A phosphatase activator TIP41
MVFGSRLDLTHEASGTTIHFNAECALREWLEEGLPPLKVAAAAVWARGHERRFGGGMPGARSAADRFAVEKTEKKKKPIPGGAAWDEREDAEAYDWTFTTPYRGSLMTRADGGAPSASGWTPTELRVDRGMLMERDPILFFDELTLYESELDDNGEMSVTLKVRVMPKCWYVLLRHWMRVDGVLLRLRETRLFHKMVGAEGAAGAAGTAVVVVRESARREETFEGLRARGAPCEPGQYPNAEEAASVLLAAGGPVAMEHHALTL